MIIAVKPALSNIPFRNQLRTRLALAFVALVVVSIVVVTAFTLYQVREQTAQQTFRQLESVAQLKQNQISRWLQNANEQLSVIFTNLNSDGAIARLLTAPQSADQNAVAISAALQNTFQTLGQNSGDQKTTTTEVFIYDDQGRVIASSDPNSVSKIVTLQPYFQPSLTVEYTQSPYYAVGSDQLDMVITHPIKNSLDQIVGVIAAHLNLGVLGDVLGERAGLGSTGETYLVSIENNYLLTPSRLSGYSLTRAYHSQGIDNALNKQDGSGIYTNYEDTATTVLGVYRWIPELNSALLAEISQNEAQSLFTQTAALIVALVIVLALIAGVIGSFAATTISRPVTELTQIATQIANGNFSMRTTVRNHTEIGALAIAFNQMTDQLTDSIVVLDKRNEELQIATSRAKEAARVKGEFLANVSHELRTPLNAIIGFSDMLLMGMSGELNPKQRHKLERLKENGVRLLTLINDILDITRIEARRVEIVNKPFSAQSLVERLSAQMAVLAEKSGLDFQTAADGNLPILIMGDEQRIEQVVINLLSNAFKFTQKGSVSLKVQADMNKETWSIAVTDTGAGIPPHALNVIFEEFRQIDGGFARAYKGSGLGLAITRNLVRLMDGQIQVDSELGNGSTFTVTLPLVPIPEKAMSVPIPVHVGV
jgi:signal transduction histidine kinase